jgi:formylglycine-generating enzyme required for sulfatase activity/CHAT domain-containing protein
METDNQVLDLSFELQISAVEDKPNRYRVEVLDSPAGQGHFTTDFDAKAVFVPSEFTQALTRSISRGSTTPSDIYLQATKTLQQFGAALFDAFFQKEVRDLYIQSWTQANVMGKILCIKLRLQDAELANLPWELLYDTQKQKFVCLLNETTLVRFPEAPIPSLVLRVSPPLCILGMVAAPKDLPELNVEKEKQNVEQALKELITWGMVKLEWVQGQTFEALGEILGRQQWHIFHFIGHGGPGQVFFVKPDTQEMDGVSADDLANLLARHASLRMVFLNACDGAKSDEANRGDIFSSTAGTIIRGGIPAVVAMQYSISDVAAVKLARRFYESLAKGLAVDVAMNNVRMELQQQRSAEWAIPALYNRAQDGILFQPQQNLLLSALTRVKPLLKDRRWVWGGLAGLVIVAVLIGGIALASKIQKPTPTLMAAIPTDTPLAATNTDLPPIVPTSTYTVIPAPTDTPVTKPSLTPTAKASHTHTPTLSEPTDTHTPKPPSTQTPTATEPPTITSTPTVTPLASSISDHDIPMVLITAGPFTMGSNKGRPEERPAHQVTLSDYYMDLYEVSNKAYRSCIQAGACKNPRDKTSPSHSDYFTNPKYDNYPVINVTWEQADTFCKWRGGQLPTEAQWEKAASGPKGSLYPWGNSVSGNAGDFANFCDKNCTYGAPDSRFDDGYEDLAPVDAYPEGVSPYGIYNMAGNVWEWVADYYDAGYYAKSPAVDPLGPDSGTVRILRGGGWHLSLVDLNTIRRTSNSPTLYNDYIGFRCVRKP